ncbi:MAG: response regulator [Anaeromyxobacteraceae bacterium]
MARILLIENDASFAASLARVLSATGHETEVVGEGKEGLARATSQHPDAIVLCVELPDMSGYLVCQKLKKDEALRSIPLVLTSADATEKSFADHQKLKVRADAYLLKPFPPQTLIDSLQHLVELPDRPAGAPPDEEELVRFEDGGDLGMPSLDLDALGDESPHLREDPRPAAPPRDEDDAFLDSLMGLGDEHPAGHDAPAEDHPDEALTHGGLGLELDLDPELMDRPLGADDVDAAAEAAPEDARDPMAELEALRDDRDDHPAPSALSLDDDDLPPIHPANVDLLRAAGMKLLDDDVGAGPAAAPTPAPVPVVTRPTLPIPGSSRAGPALDLPRPGQALRSAESTQPTAPVASLSSSQAERLERELAEVREHLADARAEVLSRESEVRQLKDKVGSSNRRAEQAEAEVRQLRTEAGELDELKARVAAAERRAEDATGARAEAERRAAEAERKASDADRRLAEAQRRVEEAAQGAAAAKAELDAQAAAGREAAQKAEALRAELAAARADLEAARAELAEAKAHPAVDPAASAALQARIAELEASSAKHEDRVVKAYQKIRNDEKVRDKVRKALSIASQLLDEGMVPDPTAERRSAASAVATPAPVPRPERQGS